MVLLFILIVTIIPIVLTGWNVFAFCRIISHKEENGRDKFIEVISILFGFAMTYLYIIEFAEIRFENWNVPIYDIQIHSMVAPEYCPTFFSFLVIAFLGFFIARNVPFNKQPPLLSVLCISAMYFGAVECILWCIQTFPNVILMLYPLNCLLLFAKAVVILCYQKSLEPNEPEQNQKLKTLSKLFLHSARWPWLALILMLPLLGIILAILILFGQQADSIIKVWSETADWTLSQKVAPPGIPYDGHYLCTVAAKGHKNIVKPIRTGIRHDHCVLVNRQLCVANAFEELLKEKQPKLHRIIRGVYDKTGYPIAKHIDSPYIADIVYFVMKPLEWFFLIALYLVDVNPENRIAVQYPHTRIP